jgi:hypothetical protein
MYTRLHTPVKGDRNDRRSGAAYRTAEPVPAYTFPVNLDCMDYPDAGKVLHKGRYIVHEPLEFGRYQPHVSQFKHEDVKLHLLKVFGEEVEKPEALKVRYIGKTQNATRKEREEHIDKYFLELPVQLEFYNLLGTYMYKEENTTLNRFMNAGTVHTEKRSRGSVFITPTECKTAYLLQKDNGAWYLAKAYRYANDKAQRAEIYLSKEDVCRKSASVEKKRRQALTYCTAKSKAAFEAKEWEQWMKWRSIRYALRLAVAADDPEHLEGGIGSEEGGGWSSIYTYYNKESDQQDALYKQSRLTPLEKHLSVIDSAAQRSARKEVYNYNWEDYNEQDKNTALLTVRALVTFTATADGEEEIARAQELSTAEDLTREEVKEETNEEVKPKRKRKEDSKAEFLRKAHIQHSGIGTGIQGGHRAVWAPSMETAAKEFTDAHDLKEVLCSVCEQMHTVVVVYKKQITLLCGHTRPVGIWTPISK